jgi:uncharacterized SAM-dependent methyltransferase
MVKHKIECIGDIPNNKELRNQVYNFNRVPTKFLFTSNGADIWNRLRHSTEYKLSKKEGSNLKNFLPEIYKMIKGKINLFHIGPGNGIELPTIIESLNDKLNSYTLIDISKKFLEYSLRNNKDIIRDIAHQAILTDIETDGNLKKICAERNSEKNLIIITNSGSMLANSDLFRILHDSMKDDDLLFLSFEGYSNNHFKILASYKSKLLQDMILECLHRANFNTDDGKFKIHFNTKENIAEVFFTTLTKNILCISSIKPKKNEFKKILESYGFIIEKYNFSKDSMISVLCRRQK